MLKSEPYRCYVNVCRIYSPGHKNTSGGNEMFLNKLINLRYKKEQEFQMPEALRLVILSQGTRQMPWCTNKIQQNG
jgi:hypothetical protein